MSKIKAVVLTAISSIVLSWRRTLFSRTVSR